jgi:hypothetical protein
LPKAYKFECEIFITRQPTGIPSEHNYKFLRKVSTLKKKKCLKKIHFQKSERERINLWFENKNRGFTRLSITKNHYWLAQYIILQIMPSSEDIIDWNSTVVSQ